MSKIAVKISAGLAFSVATAIWFAKPNDQHPVPQADAVRSAVSNDALSETPANTQNITRPVDDVVVDRLQIDPDLISISFQLNEFIIDYCDERMQNDQYYADQVFYDFYRLIENLTTKKEVDFLFETLEQKDLSQALDAVLLNAAYNEEQIFSYMSADVLLALNDNVTKRINKFEASIDKKEQDSEYLDMTVSDQDFLIHIRTQLHDALAAMQVTGFLPSEP